MVGFSDSLAATTHPALPAPPTITSTATSPTRPLLASMAPRPLVGVGRLASGRQLPRLENDYGCLRRPLAGIGIETWIDRDPASPQAVALLLLRPARVHRARMLVGEANDGVGMCLEV